MKKKSIPLRSFQKKQFQQWPIIRFVDLCINVSLCVVYIKFRKHIQQCFIVCPQLGIGHLKIQGLGQHLQIAKLYIDGQTEPSCNFFSYASCQLQITFILQLGLKCVKTESFKFFETWTEPNHETVKSNRFKNFQTAKIAVTWFGFCFQLRSKFKILNF